MGIIKARIQNENGEYSWADIATSSEHTHKVQQLEDNSILATKADLGLQALVDENGNPITDEQGNQKYNSLAQIFHDWLSDIKKDQPDWKETNTASPNYIQNKPTTIIETINNIPPDEEGNVKVDTLPAIGLGQDNFVLSAVRKNENTEEYQAEWKEIKVLPNFTQKDADSVLTVTNEENVPKIEWKKPNYDWNNISNKPNLINTLAEQDSINTDNLSEELIEKIENSGLEVKTGTTDPSVLTTGELGQIYVNTTSNTGFVCVKANENEYIWQAIGGTINADGEVSDALIAAHNSDPTAHEDIRSSIDNSIMIDKSFGNGPDTVAEGDHTHGDLQLQIQSVEEVINADYYDNSNSVEFFTEVTPSHTLWSATSSSKVTGVDIIGGRYECTTSVAEQGLKTSNLTDLVDVVKGKTIVGVANLSSDNYTLYIKMHNGTSWSFGRIKSTDKIVTVKVPDNLTQFKLGLEYGGDGSAPDTCVMTNFALYLVNDVTITSTANIPNRNYTIWSWDDEEIINPEEFASFCNAYKINRVYQHVSTSVLDLETIRKFVGTMQKNRISVNWLTGDPLWALTEHHYHIAEQIQKVVSYNMSIQNDYEKIGTIQFDIEPHALDEWNADQASVIKQYQDAVVLMYKESLAKQLSLNVCVPSWFDSVVYDNEYGQGNLFDFVSKHSSSTIIMAYSTKSYVSIAEDEIRMGALNGKNVAVGLETHAITESITEDISFANKPIEDLYRAFETLFLVYKIYGVYKGYEFVIHDYGYFKAYTDKFNLIIPPNNILDKLTTENKTDLISAINEINTEVEQLKTKYPEGEGGNCSCPTGTIEKETKIEYTMTEVPSVSCDFLDGAKLYKLSDTTFSKEELLLSEWTVQIQGQVENATWSESDIIVNTEDILMATKDGFIIVMCYKSGEITIEIDTDLIATVNIPEVGLYVLTDPEVIAFFIGMQITAKATIIEEVNFVQSNWNQNDCTKPDYIKNRPFYAGPAKEYDVLPEQTFAFERSDVGFNVTVSGFVWNETYQMYALQQNVPSFTLSSNTEYEIIWDNEEPRFCKTFEFTLGSDPSIWIGIGNGGAIGFEASDEPFMFAYNTDYNILMLGTSSNLESHSIKIGEASPRISGIQSTEYKLEQGQVYHIAWDETVYECKSRGISDNPTDAVIGNVSAIFEEDTEDLDLPFGIFYNKDNNAIFITAHTKESSHKLRIYQAEENIKKIDQKFVGTDWNQNDKNDAGYIKNRPFYEDKGIHEIFPKRMMDVSVEAQLISLPNEQIELWCNGFDKAIVVWEGVTYECKPEIADGAMLIGNTGIFKDIDNGIPFVIAVSDMPDINGMVVVSPYDSALTERTFSVSIVVDKIVQIDPKFLPSIEWSKISNKPFGTIAAGTVLYGLNTVICDIPTETEGVYYTQIDKIGFIEGAKYIVELDGVIYNCKGILSSNVLCVTGSTETAIFAIGDEYMQPGYATFMISAQGTHTLKISVEEDIVKKIDAKYLPDDIGSEIQPDWNQNDTTKSDYIKNKPKELSEEMLFTWLNEEKIVSPLASKTGEIYITNNNEIYIL